MSTLEINKDMAIKAHKNADSKGKGLLEDLFGKKTFQLSIFDRVKTVQDCFDELGVDKDSFDKRYKDLPESIYSFALMTEIIVPALNEGWEPDWDDSSYKYYAWFTLSGGGFSYYVYDLDDGSTAVGARLVFKSSQLAKYAGTQFIDVYKSFMTK